MGFYHFYLVLSSPVDPLIQVANRWGIWANANLTKPDLSRTFRSLPRDLAQTLSTRSVESFMDGVGAHISASDDWFGMFWGNSAKGH